MCVKSPEKELMMTETSCGDGNNNFAYAQRVLISS